MMDLRQMLMELLMGQPKDTSRLWAGGPTMGMPPGGSAMPMPEQAAPQFQPRGGMAPDLLNGNATVMPKSVPGMPGAGPLNMTTMPKQPAPSFGPGNMPPGFAMSGAQPPGAMPPSGPGNPGMMGFLPPGGMMPLAPGGGGGGGGATPMPGIVGEPAPSFRSRAAGLFGNGGGNLYNILADAMAGAAAADPTKPGITAFAQGFTGARGSKKIREKEGTEAEDKAYDRAGTDLDREVKSETLKMDKRKWTLDNIKKLIEIAQAQAGGDPNKFRQELIKQSASSPLGVMDQTDLDRAMSMAYPGQGSTSATQGGQQWSPGSGTPPPTGTKRYDKTGRAIMWDGNQWVDEQGNPVQ